MAPPRNSAGLSEVRASPRGKSPAANSDGEMGDPAELKSRAFICLVKQRGSRGFPAARRVVSDDIVQGRAFSPHRITTGRGPSLQQRSAFLAVWGAAGFGLAGADLTLVAADFAPVGADFAPVGADLPLDGGDLTAVADRLRDLGASVRFASLES